MVRTKLTEAVRDRKVCREPRREEKARTTANEAQVCQILSLSSSWQIAAAWPGAAELGTSKKKPAPFP